jgi:hypothetical protein
VRLANADALQQQPNAAAASDQAPPLDYVEPGLPAIVTNPINQPIDEQGGTEPTPVPFRASGYPSRPARRATAFFHVPGLDRRLSAGDVANGLHAVIARQANGMPVGEQHAFPTQQRSTLFRTPDPWDTGYVRATPGSTSAAS